LDRILKSETFRHSEQHRALLAYLVRASLQGQSDQLKEYSVGIDALGKPESYNPRQDATVRIQTGRLRARLEEYYRTEGHSDPVVFTLPKGGFKIVFGNRLETTAPESPQKGLFHNVRLLRWVCLGLLVLLAAAAGLAIRSSLTLSRAGASLRLASSLWTPELDLLWRPFLEERRPLTISLGTPLFVNLDGIRVRDAGQNQWVPGQYSPAIDRIREALAATRIQPVYGYNGFGETAGAFRLFRLFLSRGKDLTFRRSNHLSWDDFKERDLILLGSPKSVAHLKNFRDLRTRLAFDVEEDRIVNYEPQSGEAPEYRMNDRRKDPNANSNAYAVVTRLPGVDGAGSIMILGSPDTEGTLAACEYVTNPELAKDLLRRLASGGRLPEAYQVLLGLTFRTDVPLTITSLAHRVLKADGPKP